MGWAHRAIEVIIKTAENGPFRIETSAHMQREDVAKRTMFITANNMEGGTPRDLLNNSEIMLDIPLNMID